MGVEEETSLLTRYCFSLISLGTYALRLCLVCVVDVRVRLRSSVGILERALDLTADLCKALFLQALAQSLSQGPQPGWNFSALRPDLSLSRNVLDGLCRPKGTAMDGQLSRQHAGLTAISCIWQVEEKCTLQRERGSTVSRKLSWQWPTRSRRLRTRRRRR